jgi:hypothetical protein
MYCRGLPFFDQDSQTLIHREFMTPISNLRGVERVSRFGILWGVKLLEDGGRTRVCLVASRGTKRDADDVALEDALMAVMEAAYAHWSTVFTTSLGESGEFHHNGVRVTDAGEVSGCGGSGSVVHGRFSHEIDGDVLRLRFLRDARPGVVDWRPGLARDAAISVLYDIREKRSKVSPRSGVSTGTGMLRRRAKQRIDGVVRNLAAVLCRGDLLSGRAKIQAFCLANGLQPVGDKFLADAHKMLVQKSFIQKSFEDIQRYHQRIMQPRQSAELFEQLVRLGEHDGKLNARQLFALYEIGLFLAYSMPRITDMISAILGGSDPWAAGEAADIAECERQRHRAEPPQFQGDVPPGPGNFGHGRERTAAPGSGFEDFDDLKPPQPTVPVALLPMMGILGLTAVTDERMLRAAWTARVRQCHPDRLGPDASAHELLEATQATAEANMAYAVILEYLRA